MVRCNALAKDDRGFGVVGRDLHAAETTCGNVDVESPAELLVERLRAIDVGNAEQHDLEFHVDGFGLWRRFCLADYYTGHHCLLSFGESFAAPIIESARVDHEW